jgi:DNA-binding LacI/PurR family transcriptional regulator
MSAHITMKTIAAEAGVTQATVSMALAGNPRIPEETRARIRAVAERLEYRPNPYVSALMRIRRQGRPHTDKPVVALVNGFDKPDGWRKHLAPTINQMRQGAVDRATLRGYRADEFWLKQDGMSPERFSEMLRTRAIQGLLLSPLSDDMALPKLKWEYFAAVGLSVPQPSVTLTTVCNDHYFSVLQTLRECHRLGYRRPALIMRRIHRTRFHGRWDAGFFVSKHLLPGVTLAKPLLFDDWPDLDDLPRWLAREKPDIIVSPLADTLLKLLNKHGWSVPKDIGLAWISCSRADHPISGVYQNGHLIGATAMDTLISMIERNERGLPPQAVTLMIEGVWNPGQTLRAEPEA